MLLEVSVTHVTHRCDFCGASRSLAHADLVAGVVAGETPTPTDPNIIVLPACGECGAQEFLNRVPAVDRGGGRLARAHRSGVNALHAALVDAGRIAPSLAAVFASDTAAYDRAELPWAFPGEPRSIVGRRDGSPQGGA